ncbi:MAG TPA: ABC transporter permease, partial [Clostridiaceae bacterium]|nr:ABC transporter permease [Clostridiaceae bacterium]
KGVSRVRTIGKHALKNGVLPIVTYFGPMLAGIVTGSLVVENVFTIGGLGQEFVQSINNRDYPVIMGVTIFLAVLLIILTLVSDLLYKVFDPRITFD